MREFLRVYPDFIFYGFEAQKELLPYAQKIKEEFPDRIAQLEFKAVSTHDGTADFYLAQQWGENYRGASTLVLGQGKEKRNIDFSNPVNIETINFSRWIKKMFHRDDYLIVKMDIEGSEFPVLTQLVHDNSLDYINEIFIEFHNEKKLLSRFLRKQWLVYEIRKRGIMLHPWK